MRRVLLPLLGTVLVAVEPVAAHVDYVTEGNGESPDPLAFLLSVVTNPINAALLGAGAVVVLLGVVLYLRVGRHVRDIQVLRETLVGYGDLVPWMLRLSLGLPLVGAGYAGYVFTPAAGTDVRLLQLFFLGVGFLLLFGLATRAVAVLGLVAYLVGLASNPRLLLAFEYVCGFLAVLLLGSGRPSADEMLQRVAETPGTLYGRVDPVHRVAERFGRVVDPLSRFVPTIVRVGLGATFVLLGVGEKLLAPGRALEVVATYDLTGYVPVDPGLWVVGAGLVEVAVGVALLLGLFTRGVAAVAFLVLTTTLFGLPDDPVLAHVTLFGLTSAVFTMGGGPFALDAHVPEWLPWVGPTTAPT